MFFALSEQLDLIKGIQKSHDELRRTIVQHLRENRSLVSSFGYYFFDRGFICNLCVIRRIGPQNFFFVVFKVKRNKVFF